MVVVGQSHPCAPTALHVDLVREIDAAIALPKLALPEEMYARFYALRPDGKVEVVLSANLPPPPPPGPLYRAVPCEEAFLRDGDCPPQGEARGGDRYWVDYRRLPTVADSGCRIIRAVYDPATRHVATIGCSGLRHR